MTYRAAVILFELSVLGTALPVFAEELSKRPVQVKVTTTERANFAPGGTIHVDGSYGALSVEGWERPEVEITVTKSMPYDYKLKHPEQAAQHLAGVNVAMKRSSDTELAISTTLPARAGWFPPLSRTTTGSVMLDYEIHVPRDSKLAIHHGTGIVLLRDVSGDVDATCSRGDIVVMLADSGSYAIDAATKFGTVTSDFEGTPRIRRYRLGELYAAPNSPPSPRIHLRTGFGGVTIKALPKEARGAGTAGDSQRLAPTSSRNDPLY